MTKKQTLNKIKRNEVLINKAKNSKENPKLMVLLIERLVNNNRELRESLK